MGQEAAILHPQTTSLKKLPLAVFLSSDRQQATGNRQQATGNRQQATGIIPPVLIVSTTQTT